MKFFELIDVKNLNTQFNALDVVHCALEMGLFELIETKELSIREIADERNAKIDTMVQIIDCLHALDFVTIDNAGIVKLTEEWKELYHSKQSFNLFSLLKGAYRSHQRWQSIQAIALQDEHLTQHEDEMFSSGNSLARYLEGVMEQNREHAQQLSTEIAKDINQSGYIKVADVAGGHGRYLFEVLERCPQISATLMDLPATLEVFHELNGNNAQREKITLLPIDLRQALNDDVKYDVVLLNDLLHSFNSEDKSSIVKRLLSFMHPNSLLVISKFDYGENNMSVEWALFSMHLHVNSTEGYLEKNEELESMFADCQLTVQRRVTIGEKISYFCRINKGAAQ